MCYDYWVSAWLKVRTLTRTRNLCIYGKLVASLQISLVVLASYRLLEAKRLLTVFSLHWIRETLQAKVSGKPWRLKFLLLILVSNWFTNNNSHVCPRSHSSSAISKSHLIDLLHSVLPNKQLRRQKHFLGRRLDGYIYGKHVPNC